MSTDIDFYNEIADEFDLTRQHFWRGWAKVREIIENSFGKSKTISVIDLGCGNSRFYKYLFETFKQINVLYTGIDQNDYFLGKSKKLYPSNEYIKGDIFLDISNITNGNKFDICCAFGVSHHLPNDIELESWINNLIKSLNNNGVLIISFWQTKKIPTDGYLNWNKSEFKRSYRNFPQSHIETAAKHLGLKYYLYYAQEGKKDGNYYLVIYNII